MKELDKSKIIIEISLKDFEELKKAYDNFESEVETRTSKEIKKMIDEGLIMGVDRALRIKTENKSFVTYHLANSIDLLYGGFPLFITIDKLNDVVGSNIEHLKSDMRELIDTNARYESNWFVKLFLKRK